MSETKQQSLIRYLSSLDNSIIAYSGGVDSTLLIKAAKMAGIRFLAVTSCSETVPAQDLERARSITSDLGIDHRTIETSELSDHNFTDNPPERCFFCKDILFGQLNKIAKEEGYEQVLDGSNADDLSDYRPGLKAARKHGIISPLIEVGLTKRDIRAMSRKLGLPTWDNPSSPCLSSRFPYGRKITADGLRMVSEAEDYLRSLGFRVVRVRTTETSASVEVGEDELTKLHSADVRRSIEMKLKLIGYNEVTFDPEGYSSGKLNRSLGH
jgi:uncharacterized protein